MLSVKKFVSGLVCFSLCVFIMTIGFAASDATEAVPEDTVSDTVSDAVPEDVLEDVPEATSANAVDDSPVLSVVFPEDISFVIDPFEIKKRGQVFSEEYYIENRSDTNVIVTIESFYYEFLNDTDFESLAEPFNEEEETDLKAIYMQANFSTGKMLVLSNGEIPANAEFLLKAAAFDDSGVLHEGSRLTFSFSGGVTPYPLKKWNDDDVKVHMKFFTTQVESEEAAEEIAEDEFAEEDSLLQVQVEIPDKDDNDTSEHIKDLQEAPETSNDEPLASENHNQGQALSRSSQESHSPDEPEAPE